MKTYISAEFYFSELSRAEEGKQILEEKVKELTQAEEKLMHETEILQTALKQKEEQESAMNTRYHNMFRKTQSKKYQKNDQQQIWAQLFKASLA